MADEAGRQILLFSIFVGIIAFAIAATLWLMRERRRLVRERDGLEAEHATLRARLTRTDALLDVPDQRLVIWTAGEERPHLRGRLASLTDVPDERGAFIAFGAWMTPETARPFVDAVEDLRERAAAFDMVVETRGGQMIETQGRASGALAFVRFQEMTEDRAQHARMKDEHARVAARLDVMMTLFERMDWPAWLRDADGRLQFANRAYVAAVEGTSADSVRRHSTPLLDSRDRQEAERHHEANRDAYAVRASLWHRRLPVTVAGDRRMLDVSEACTAAGTAGFAVDMSEVEAVRAERDATVASHVRTLNHLTSAVISFDEHRRLRSYNQAFLRLWNLSPSVLEDGPDNAAVFEELRAMGRIAEQRDFREWRDGVLAVYRSSEIYEDRWILPDGRTVRVIANPEGDGGVTWVFENVTEQQELETAFAELTRVQRETLDHLVEAVAVFGADGRLKLSNPAFATVWGLPEDLVQPDAPLSAIVVAMQEATLPHDDGADVWETLVPMITGTGERTTLAGQLRARPVYDGVPRKGEPEQRVLDYALVPLPDGQAMMTFVDVTATIRVERALTERNEALLEAERLKNRFLNRVSVAFRAPLQTVEGFAGMLHSGAAGPLDDRQSNYVNYIMASTAELTRLVDNTLNLATMQSGLAALDLEECDVGELLRAVSHGMTAALTDRGQTLELDIAPSAGRAVLDCDRIRDAIANLMSNAARHSPAGGRVRLAVTGAADGLEIVVADEGPGIARDMADMIFENFETGPGGQGSAGAGLGLPLVRAIIEMHDGTIELASDDATLSGAAFRVRLPRRADDAEDRRAGASDEQRHAAAA